MFCFSDTLLCVQEQVSSFILPSLLPPQLKLALSFIFKADKYVRSGFGISVDSLWLLMSVRRLVVKWFFIMGNLRKKWEKQCCATHQSFNFWCEKLWDNICWWANIINPRLITKSGEALLRMLGVAPNPLHTPLLRTFFPFFRSFSNIIKMPYLLVTTHIR